MPKGRDRNLVNTRNIRIYERYYLLDGSEEASLRRRFEEIEHGRVLSLGKPYHANHQGYDPGWCDRGWQEDRKALVHRLQVEASLYILFIEIVTLRGGATVCVSLMASVATTE